MAQWVKALVILEEEPGLVSGTHMVIYKHRHSSFRGYTTFFKPPQAPDTYVMNIHTLRQNSHRYKTKSKKQE